MEWIAQNSSSGPAALYRAGCYKTGIDDCVIITDGSFPELLINSEYIELEDLLHHFHDPNIMDIKMGTRFETKIPFLFSESLVLRIF